MQTIVEDDVQQLSKTATNLFRVLKVLKQSILSPYNALLHVGGRIRETIDRTGLTTEKTARGSARVEENKECSYPCKLGPTLLGSPAPTVWHRAQLLLKMAAPLLASPEIASAFAAPPNSNEYEQTWRVRHCDSL